jgi:lambda repressor-like predicted transcriptional regulator
MTPDEVDEGIALVRDWLDDYPEGTVIALFEARAWEVKGYADWDALCAAEFPRKVQLPRPERRELVGRMREAGMSTRAIASAVGIHHSTVAEDISTVGNPTVDTVTGLDGRTRPTCLTCLDVDLLLTSGEHPDQVAARLHMRGGSPSLTAHLRRDGHRSDLLPTIRRQLDTYGSLR